MARRVVGKVGEFGVYAEEERIRKDMWLTRPRGPPATARMAVAPSELRNEDTSQNKEKVGKERMNE